MVVSSANTLAAPPCGDVVAAPNSGRVWWILLGIWGLCTIIAMGCVVAYSSDIPFADEYGLTPVLTGEEPLTWQWLWSQHNEHRIVLPKLVLYGLHQLTGRGSAGMYLNVCMLSLAAWLTMLAAVKQRGHAAATDAFLPVVWLHLGQMQNLLWSFQVGFVLPSLLTAWIIYVITVDKGRLRGPRGFAATMCIALLPLCGGNGLLVAAPLAIWMTATLWVELRAPFAAGRAWTWAMALVACLTYLLLGCYFVGLQPVALPASGNSTLWQAVVAASHFLNMGLGPRFNAIWPWGGLVILALLGFSLGGLVKTAWSRGPVSCMAWGYAAILAGALLHAIAVGHSRAAVGGLVSRYTTLMLPAFAAAYLSMPLFLRPRRASLAQSLLLVLGLVMLLNAPHGLDYARRFHARRSALLRDLQAGMPAFVLAERYYHHPFGLYFLNASLLNNRLMMLHRAKIHPFDKMRPNPAFRVIQLSLAGDEIGGPPSSVTFERRTKVYFVVGQWRYAGTPSTLRVTISGALGANSAEQAWKSVWELNSGFSTTTNAWIDQQLASMRVESEEFSGEMDVARVFVYVATDE